jgi:hypothetical protein
MMNIGGRRMNVRAEFSLLANSAAAGKALGQTRYVLLYVHSPWRRSFLTCFALRVTIHVHRNNNNSIA